MIINGHRSFRPWFLHIAAHRDFPLPRSLVHRPPCVQTAIDPRAYMLIAYPC